MKETKNLLRNKKKTSEGITLISLVITIIVLLILATVTILALTGENGLFGKVKETKIKTETAQVKEQIQLAIMGCLKESEDIDIGTLKTRLGEIEDITEVSDTNGDFPIIITNKDGEIYRIDEDGDITPAKIYHIGDMVSIQGENFYVIKDSNASEDTVRLLTEKNVKTNSKPYKQDNTAGNVSYGGSQCTGYDNSTIKTLVDDYVQETLGLVINTEKGEEAKLMSRQDFIDLGGRFYRDESTWEPRCSANNVPQFAKNTKYWMDFAYSFEMPIGSRIRRSYNVGSNDAVYENNVDGSASAGLRPVLVVLKSTLN